MIAGHTNTETNINPQPTPRDTTEHTNTTQPLTQPSPQNATVMEPRVITSDQGCNTPPASQTVSTMTDHVPEWSPDPPSKDNIMTAPTKETPLSGSPKPQRPRRHLNLNPNLPCVIQEDSLLEIQEEEEDPMEAGSMAPVSKPKTLRIDDLTADKTTVQIHHSPIPIPENTDKHTNNNTEQSDKTH